MIIDNKKQCSHCKEIKLINEFHKNRSQSDGLSNQCKKCKIIGAKSYNLKHKEERAVYMLTHRPIYNAALKKQVFDYYGGCCAWPGCEITDVDVLTIDHINGGGNKHRKEIGTGNGNSFYLWLIRNNFPIEFRILCWNHQWKAEAIKRKEKHMLK